LRQEGGAVAHVAVEDGDRHGTAPTVRHQAIVDLQLVPLPIAIVAPLGQRTRGAFEIARGEVVEHEAPRREVARRERPLDPVLPRAQPIHRRIQVVFAGVAHAEVVCQGAGLPPPRRGEFRVGGEHAGGHHRRHQIGLGTATRREQASKPEAVHRGEDRVDVAVREGPHDLEVIRGHERLPPQRATNQGDDMCGQMRQIAQGFIADPRALAVTAPQ
jgi:hypothetical protein